MAQYKFILSNGTVTYVAHPDYKSGLSKVYAYEQEHKFMRATLSDSLVFIDDDYDWIMSQSFETKLLLTIQVDWDGDGTFADYWKGSFHQTDCTINTDDKSVKVKPNVEDRYNKILAGLEKEYNIIKLTPANQPVSMKRRPLFQIYTIGEDVVNCFLGGMAWEQEVADDSLTESQLEDDMHFGHIADFIQVSFTDPPEGLTNGFFGTWDHGDRRGEWDDFNSEDGVYRMTYFQTATYNEGAEQNVWHCENGLRIYAIGGNTVLWEFSQSADRESIYFNEIPATFTMTGSGGADLSAAWSGAPVFGRWLLGQELENSYKIPTSDLVPNNRNYRYCYPWIASGVITMTTRSSATPTQYGIRTDGRYYLPPTFTYDEQLLIRAVYPVSRSAWGMASIWLIWWDSMAFNEESMRTDMTLRDAYTLEAVISVLLGEIDPTITFQATSAYSQFLYGTNPLITSFGRLVLTPKSNLLVAEYTQPAQKAPVTLGEVLSMLKNLLGLYWYVDDSKRLRIEHIRFFKNGMSYSGTPSVGWDVTQMFNSRNGHSWALGTGTYQFDKMEMPERYEYTWMDNVADPFKGDPIEVLSTFVQEGNIEEITIAKFNADVDYIMLNPSDVSEDGFALMCCTVTGNVFHVPFQTQTYDGKKLTIQNFKLAMINVQPAFLISDMPAWSIKVNGSNTTALGIQRKKKQQLNVPIGNTDGTLTQLVKTTIGDGEVEQLTINLSSRMAKMQLRYDTTEQ